MTLNSSRPQGLLQFVPRYEEDGIVWSSKCTDPSCRPAEQIVSVALANSVGQDVAESASEL